MQNYYVYVCYVDDQVKYVGKGKGKRYLHCVSGKSTCAELNRICFLGKELKVEKVFDNLTEYQAKTYEQEVIQGIGLSNLYNKNNSVKTDSLKTRADSCIFDLINHLHKYTVGHTLNIKDIEKIAQDIDIKYDKPIYQFSCRNVISKILEYCGYKRIGRSVLKYKRESNTDLHKTHKVLLDKCKV